MNERDLFLEVIDQRSSSDRERCLDRIAEDDPTLAEKVRCLVQVHDGLVTVPPLTIDGVDQAPILGDFLGRYGVKYKLLQKLGEGGMGTVWAADQLEPVRRRVAIKLIREGVDSQTVNPRFDQERQVLALMDHPHIARVFDAGVSDRGRPYFVMELVKGHTLTEYADSQQLSLSERVNLFIPVCRAVQHAHRKGVIHRDLKPSNVLVGLYDGEPIPKVIDFGVAKAIGPRLIDRSIFTHIGLVVGTPQYMAPEQAELDNVDVDTRADVYSLGVILYELITGSTPIQNEGASGGLLDLLRRVRESDPVTPSDHLSTSRELPAIAARRSSEPRQLSRIVRGELDWIVMRSLEKERDRRYQSCEDLALDLENYLAGRPVVAGPASRRYRLGKFFRNHRAWVTTACLFVLTLIVATTVSVTLFVRAKQAEADAITQAKQAEKDRLAQQRETAISRSVVALIQDVLSQADPVRQGANGTRRDPNLTVKVALDRTAGRVENAFNDQPLTEAAIRFTLGRAYQSLGHFAESKKHLTRAVELRSNHLGATHLDTLATKQLLSSTLAALGLPKRAEELLQEVLQGLPESEVALRRAARHAYAHLLEQMGRYGETAIQMKELITEYEASLGATSSLAIACRARLAEVEGKLGRFQVAEAGFRTVLAQKSQLGEDHPLILSTMANLANLQRMTGRPLEAIASLEAMIALSDSRLGSAHPHTLGARITLAVVQHELKLYEVGECEIQAVAFEAERTLGPDHELTLTAQFNHAEFMLSRGELASAEPLFQMVLARRIVALGQNHPATQSARLGLGGLFYLREDWSRAEALFRTVIETGQSTEDSYLSALNNLGVMLRRLKRYDDAEPIFKEAFRLALERFGSGHPTTELFFNNVISFYEHRQQSEKAIQLATERLASLHDVPSRASTAADVEAMLGRVHLRSGQFQLAENCFRSALDRYSKANRTDWRIGYAQSQLGAALCGLEKPLEATRYLELGYQKMRQNVLAIPVADRVSLLDQAMRRHADNLIKMGRQNEAAQGLDEHSTWVSEGAKP